MKQSGCCGSLRFVILMVVLVAFASRCEGVTSKFRRKLEATEDMPFDSDVFSVPDGYNAPQQNNLPIQIIIKNWSGIQLITVSRFYEGNEYIGATGPVTVQDPKPKCNQIATFGMISYPIWDTQSLSVIVSWVTPTEPGSSTVLYGTSEDKLDKSAKGKHGQYKYYNYTSGFIHHATLKHLKYDTKYYYAIGVGQTVRKFWFKTPPQVGPDIPYTFGLIGDLGQTYDSNRTLSHYESNMDAEAVLFVGDLSYADHYADHDNRRWDSWGRFVERSTAYQPWIWTAGNHELDFAPELGETVPFKPFTNRYHTPYKASNSTAPFWYSIKRGSAYIIVLSSYSAYGKYTPQYEWLYEELPKVNRSETPWLIVLMHSPWYNSYNYHYMEGETMRVMYEQWFVQYKVDVVFAGHVHAYERSHRISNTAYNIVNEKCTPVPNQDAPVYITIGDGGNIEGLATNMTEPQPSYSAFREASFGHAIFDIKNKTHAYYTWHRNQDGEKVTADSMWFTNRFWLQTDDSSNVV